jgi:hypothetical protein
MKDIERTNEYLTKYITKGSDMCDEFLQELNKEELLRLVREQSLRVETLEQQLKETDEVAEFYTNNTESEMIEHDEYELFVSERAFAKKSKIVFN